MEGKADEYRYKSLAVRRELEKEGFALEAYVYYTLFLSGKFDNIRSNVRIRTGTAANGRPLEKELDILVTLNEKMGVISCKDTDNIQASHISGLVSQAECYGVNAKPILVCSSALSDELRNICNWLHVSLLDSDSRHLDRKIINLLK